MHSNVIQRDSDDVENDDSRVDVMGWRYSSWVSQLVGWLVGRWTSCNGSIIFQRHPAQGDVDDDNVSWVEG